jgi:hypothetical protein
MDYINGCRIGIEMTENISDFSDGEQDIVNKGSWNDSIPF